MCINSKTPDTTIEIKDKKQFELYTITITSCIPEDAYLIANRTLIALQELGYNPDFEPVKKG